MHAKVSECAHSVVPRTSVQRNPNGASASCMHMLSFYTLNHMYAHVEFLQTKSPSAVCHMLRHQSQSLTKSSLENLVLRVSFPFLESTPGKVLRCYLNRGRLVWHPLVYLQERRCDILGMSDCVLSKTPFCCYMCLIKDALLSLSQERKRAGSPDDPYRVVPGSRNWQVETALEFWPVSCTIFRNLLAGIWGSFLRVDLNPPNK